MTQIFLHLVYLSPSLRVYSNFIMEMVIINLLLSNIIDARVVYSFFSLNLYYQYSSFFSYLLYIFYLISTVYIYCCCCCELFIRSVELREYLFLCYNFIEKFFHAFSLFFILCFGMCTLFPIGIS